MAAPLHSGSDRLSKAVIDRRYDAFIGQLSDRGRAGVAKGDETREDGKASAIRRVWRRIAGCMAELAPHATEIRSATGAKFYIPDGKYKQQVFAIEHTGEDKIIVHIPDVAELAVTRRLLGRGSSPSRYVAHLAGNDLVLDVVLAGDKDVDLCKGMLGWGRRALRAELSVQDGDDRLMRLEALCRIAAEQWTPSGPAPGGSPPSPR